MSIYDFASTSAESVKDTDFSTNYGFNVVPNATGIPYDEHFSRGLYHYANIGKDADQLRLAQEAFGKNMLDKKFAPYWIGEAVVREHGFSDITQAYIAYDIPIPEGVTDSMQLSATLGQGILDKYSKQYDTAKAAREKSANRAANNQQKLMAGTIKPADLDPEQTQELVDIYGYHPADAYSAGEIIRSRDKKDILSQVWEPTKFMLAEAASLPSRIGEFGAYAFKGDFKDAFRRLAHSSSGWEKIATQSLEGTRSALANNLASDAKFLALANNPEKALQIAQNHFYKKEKELLDNATALGRAVLKTHDIVQDTYQGAGDLLVSATGAINAAIGNADDPRQAQRVSASIADAKAAARAEVQESHSLYGWMEKGFDAIAETARFANPYTAVPAVASLFRDCAGRSFNSIANEDGSLPADSNLEVYGKAAANAAINYASRNVGTKVMPRVMSRGLTKLGVHSSAARYAANAGWTTAGFGIVLPIMDSGLRAAYDALAVKNPKLKDGIRDLENWWNKDLRSPSYWGTQSLVGAFFGITGQRNYHRAGKFLAQNAEMSGLSHDEADSIRRSTILEDQPQAYQKAISDNLLNKPQETIDLALANTRKAVSEQEQLAREEKGKKAESDAALQASMRFYGLSFAEGKDSDHVTMLIGGHIDKATGKYIEGTKSVSLTKKDAAFYIGNLLDARTASRTTAIREMMGRALFIDAAKKHLEGQIEIQYILSPLDMNQMIQNGTEAQAKIDKLTKDLIEKSKGEDGKPTLSETDARSQAEQTKEGDRTLGEIAKFGREVQSRLSQEQNKQLSQDPDKSFISNAYVLSKGKRSDNSLRRIFKIAWGATTRNMMEEYSEQWMQDYFFATGSDYTDLWRLLSDLSAHLNIPNFTLATLRNSNPALAERLDNGLTSQDITDAADFDAIYRDVTEGLSVLLMADLGKLSADGKLPEWTQELLDSKFLTDQLMEQEMALAAALDTARSMGADKPAMLRLLDLNANEASRIISSIENPTVDQFFDTYVSTVKEYEALQGNPTGLSADAIESTMVQHAKDAEALAKQVKDADDERNAAAIEAVKEAESLPENKDKSHEQIVEEVNERITTQKEEDIAENPASVDDSSSTNGKAVVTYDDGSLSCHMAMVNIADLTMMPNFKSGSDKDTGEVEQLTGDYHPDHDPIRILRRTDGTLMVISGRHRLAHAKRYGAKKIAAYIYDETPEHDLKWAQLKDIERNIKDNQATPLDVALLIRGELIDGIPPLDDASIIRMGITRKGSQAIIGYNIGKNATPALMEAWRNDPDTFTTDTTRRIAQFAPNNPLIQRAGIKAATEGITGKNLLTIMSMEQDRINYLQNSGIAIQLDLFNEADFDTTYNDFVNNYAFNKVNKLNLRIAALRTAEKVANDADFAEAVQGSGLRIDNALRKRYQNRKNKPMSPQEERMLWSNPWTNMDVIGEEINNAFAKEYPEEWTKMQERKAEQTAALDTPTAEDTPDLGNSVQGDVSSIPTWDFSAVDKDTLKAWQQDPTLGLGMLGSFENNILNKFAPTHDNLVDAELVAMINDVTRRIKELHHVNAKGSSETLMAEMAAIVNKLNSRLPQGYRFGLEGYQMFTATYANLHKYGDPDSAASVLPMDKWPEIMAKSFRKTFERLLKGKLTEQEETSFFNRYDSELVGVDLDAIRKDLNSTRRKYLKEATRQFPAEAKFTDAYKAAVADARERAYDDVKSRHEAAFAKAYEAIATMRADRLMDKFLTRIIHQLNKYRKDRIINKIGRALASITPTKQKKGKPVKGTVSMETYNTVLDNYRLMRLTTAQKDSFEEANPNLADKDPQETLDVPTFDHEGTPITLKVTVQQYLTYASLDSMSAEHALAASQALGTLITSGKEAWQLKAEAEREELKAFTSPIYNKYAEDENQQGIRQRNENAFITFGKGVAKGIKRFLVGLYNDGQFFDVISAAPGLEQFKKVQDRIAKAHTYMESAEKQNHLNLIKAACAACGIKNADPFHLTGEQEQKLARFMEAINERKQLKGSDQITLTIQPPDFEAQQRDIFRTRFMRRLQFITNKKNYNPHELAVALEHVRPYLPADIYHEAMEKYGNAGDTSLYDGKVETALVNTFPLEKFGSLINLNNSIRETAAEKLAKWHKDNPTTSVTFTEMTRSEAAFKVLMTEQPDLAESLRQQGYTDAVIKQLKNFAGKDMMDFAYALREHMNERLPQLKSIYESTYGTPFPAVENYFRAFFNVSSKETSTAQQEGMPFGSNGKSEGGLRLFNTRVKHNHSIMPTMDVVHAFYLGMKEQDNLIAYADSTTGQHIGEFMRKVLSSKQGRTTMHQVLENAIGSQATAALNEHVENMYRIYGHTESYNAALNRGVSDMGTAATISLLTMRLTSIFKNALAFTNTLGGSDKISAWQWIKEAGKAMALQKGAITAKELMKDPLIRDRFKGWDTESYIDTIMIQAGVKSTLNWGTKLARRGLSVFGAYDRWATAKSAAILYNAVYNKLQKQNPSMTDAELRIEAYDAVAQALGVKGQPMDFRQRPLTSTRNNFMTAAYYFLGGEALNTFGDCLRLLAKASFKTPEGIQALGNLAAVWLVNGAMMSLINYGFNFLLDDEEHWKKRSFLATMGWGILHGPISGIPLVSSIFAEAEEGAGRLFGFNPPYLSTPSYLPMSNIFTQIGNLRKVVSEKSSTWDKTIAANDAIRAILFLGLVGTQRPTTKTGVAIKTAGIIGAAASNAIDFLLRLGRAADERWITPVPEPKKKVKKPKKSTSPKRSPRQNNSDDLLTF